MKEVLLEQFTACYDEDGWFVALRKALDGVTADNAVWKPEGADHSIWELVNHTIFWNERWLKPYRGEINQPQDVENTGTFLSGESDWQATLEHLWAVMDEWRAKLETITDEKLGEQVNDEWQVPWRSPLGHQNIHNAYHIGQIVLLRKLQGSWDSSKGVS
ncbi:MAG: DinB family protein [Pyrinomonadaceae bacterium]